jgi:pimeloyl-ACP methyl ester carboxylesterase
MREPSVVLIHGFGTDHRLWEATGWTRQLQREGRRVVAVDLLGHGASPKPEEPDAYAMAAMIDHVLSLIDAAPVDIVGYSLGGELALELALAHPGRVRRVVAGGIGSARPLTPAMAEALSGPPSAAAAAGDDVAAAAFLAMLHAAAAGDVPALTACLLGVSRSPKPDRYDAFTGPALLFAGADDPLAHGIVDVAAALPDASLIEIPGRDHRTALAASAVKHHALGFLLA